MVMRLPEADRVSLSVEKLRADLVVAFGGRVAEELCFGAEKVTTGASNDIKQATNMAKHMVMEWGMSEKLGPVAYSENEQEVFLGHSVTQTQNNSDETAKIIDAEVKSIIETAYDKATQILTDYRHELDIIGNGLIEYETLSGDEIRNLLDGTPPDRGGMGGNAGGDGKRRSTIPTAGHKKDSSDGSGIEPEPQPGE
jgi:cell division protease FtsH